MSAPGTVVATKMLYAPDAHCSRCDWRLQDADARKARREVRRHVAETAHSVWIDWNTSSRYDYVPASGSAPGHG